MIQIFSQILAALVFSGPQAQPDPHAGQAPAPQEGSIRVVELFTSQGCPMCPGANALLADLGESRDDVLALAYGVSYWDVYGWSDTFAMESFVARQQAYVETGEARRVYTPHFVINGAPDKLHYDDETVRAALLAAPALAATPALEVSLSMTSADGALSIALDGPARERPAEIWALAYAPGVQTRLIEDGPNAGREMIHYNMVRQISPVADWSGGASVFTLDAPEPGLAAAVLVQDGRGGRIIAAARADHAQP